VGGTYLVRLRTLVTAAAGRLLSRINPFAPHNLARDLRALTSRSVDVLLAFSEGDPGTDQLKLHAGHALRSLSAGPHFHLVQFADADHTFTQLDAQRRLREFLVKHLTARFA
jgi:dienelactone hydrolase